MNRYSDDTNSDFYKLKHSLMNFILAVMEGKNEAIVDVHTRELELTMLVKIMCSSVRQLVAHHVKKIPYLHRIDQITLSFKDLKTIKYFFDSNPSFSNHILLEIAVKIFSYIKIISQKRRQFDCFQVQNRLL